MAKKADGGNKSARIRDYAAANPGAKPKKISEVLSGEGLDVSPAYVSTILSKAGLSRRGGAKRRRRTAAKAAPARARAAAAPRAAASTAGRGGKGMSVDSLLRAKKLVDELGGVRNAKSALEALERLVG